MVDGYPDYLRLSSSAMADVVMMNDSDKKIFLDNLCEMFCHILEEDYQPNEYGGFVGRAIRRQYEEMCRGIAVYMSNVNNGRKRQCRSSAEAVPEQCLNQQNRTERRTEQNRLEEKLEQTRTELQQKGFLLSEIDQAIQSVNDPSKVRNWTTYLSGIIRNQRNQKPTSSAQQYNQRDYSRMQAKLDADQDAEMQEWLKQRKESKK